MRHPPKPKQHKNSVLKARALLSAAANTISIPLYEKLNAELSPGAAKLVPKGATNVLEHLVILGTLPVEDLDDAKALNLAAEASKNATDDHVGPEDILFWDNVVGRICEHLATIRF